MQVIDQLQTELQQARQVAAAKEKQIQDAINAAQRAIEESEYMQAQRAEAERIEQARQAKLATWRENALHPAKQRLQATQQQYADWLDNVRDVQAQLTDLQTRLAQMSSEVRSVADDLLRATVSADWVGTFATDEQMESFVNAEVATLPAPALAWLPFPALTDKSFNVGYEVKKDLHGHVTGRAAQTPKQSFVKSKEQLRQEDFERMRNGQR